MSNCSNCYSGCVNVYSDQCVRYTGIDVPVLGIKTGDSLSYVEQALITFLVSTLDGTGIKPTIPSEVICDLVSQYLPECEDLSEVDLFKALIQAVCNLQEQIDVQKARIDVIEADYDIDCLDGVAAGDGTHTIVQAIITKLCSVSTDLTALALNVATNYVALADLNELIQAYLDTLAPATQFYTRMIPYSPIPYMGSLSNFDITGAGTGDWINIYLCNGLNGTPDFRGRIPVGAIVGVSGGTLPAQVNPSSSIFNPNYSLGDTVYGVNSIILSTSQIPSHVHSITDVTHSHLSTYNSTANTGNVSLSASYPISGESQESNPNRDYQLVSNINDANVGKTSDVYTGITSTNSTGGSTAHDNKQPSIATYWIIYLP